MSKGTWPFYLSYSWKKEDETPLLLKLEVGLKAFPKLRLVYDRKKCEPGDSISAFLSEVAKAPRLLLFLSQDYFESEYTLKEFAIALKHGGLYTRIRVVLIGDFRLDKYLQENKDKVQTLLDSFDIDLNLDDVRDDLSLLSDAMVDIADADKNTEFGPVLHTIQNSYQRYNNPNIEKHAELFELREKELFYLRNKIDQIFADGLEINVLREHVIKKIGANEYDGNMSKILCPSDIGDEQQHVYESILYPAIRDVLEQHKWAGISNALLDQCVDLVLWIATSFVNDMWVKEHKVSLTDFYSPYKISIPLDNGHLIDLVMSRAAEKKPQYRFLNYQLESDSGIVFKSPDAGGQSLYFVFSKLMAVFRPSRDISDMSKKNWEYLEQAVRIRKAKEYFYIGFHFPDRWQEVSRALDETLPCLNQFWIEEKGQLGKSLLLVSEPKVDAILNETVKLIESYRKYVKQN